MPKIVILPHQDLCPDGAVLEANSGETILDAALRNGIEIEHACEKSCASFVKVLTHCRKAQSRKTTCWTKPGDWSRKAV